MVQTLPCLILRVRKIYVNYCVSFQSTIENITDRSSQSSNLIKIASNKTSITPG